MTGTGKVRGGAKRHTILQFTVMSASNAENDAAPSHYPPPYALSETGFPPGYFVIRNLATGKLLDVERDERHDGKNYTLQASWSILNSFIGAEVILFPETEFSRVLSEWSLFCSEIIH